MTSLAPHMEAFLRELRLATTVGPLRQFNLAHPRG